MTQVDSIRVERSIRIIRGDKVILDEDLAELYGVEVKRLNEQVRRNIDRFPADFMFQLTNQEFSVLRSQIATAKSGRKKWPWWSSYITVCVFGAGCGDALKRFA